MNNPCKKLTSMLAVVTVIAASFLFTGCNLLPAEEEVLEPPMIEPSIVEYKTTPLTRGEIVVQMSLVSFFYSDQTESLSFKESSGRIKAVYVELGQMVKAGDLIAELDSASLATQIRLQEIEVEKGNLDLAQAKAGGADEYTIKRINLNREQQQIRLGEMKKQMDATQIKATFDGKVILVSSLAIGDWVNSYQEVARIADLSDLLLYTAFSKGGDLPIGAIVDVLYKEEVLKGEVVANATTTAQDPNEKLRNAALIRIQGELPDDVTLGIDAKVVFVQQKVEDVLILPKRFINQMFGRRYVNVLEDGVRVEKDVEIGITTDTEVEILKGLAEGDLIITN